MQRLSSTRAGGVAAPRGRHHQGTEKASAAASVQAARIEAAGLGNLHFSWSGTEAGKPYYYRIHGPTVLIEFDNNYAPGRSDGPVNHIHTVWRDSERDYGEDLLRRHYEESPHHRKPQSGADQP